MLIAGPESDREPDQAVPLARRAVVLVPDDGTYLNTLGLALYRTARYDEAILVLGKSLAANNKSSVPYNLFVLALCHARRGHGIQARVFFDRALSWQQTNSKLPPVVEQELKSLRAEAEMALRAPLQDLPDDVFAKSPRPG